MDRGKQITALPQRVLVLGGTGMLGSMVTRYLHGQSSYEVWASVRSPEDGLLLPLAADRTVLLDARADDVTLASILHAVRPTTIINCMGIIKPFCRDDDPQGVERAIQVNALFPHRLAAVAETMRARVIQIATDCVFSGKTGNYGEDALHDAEDVYGKTKSLGEVRAPNVLHVRASIIGPELRTYASLFEWFLRQPNTERLQGFSHHRWNGITTLQFAECCGALLRVGPEAFDRLIHTSSVHHFVPNASVTKYELLSMLARMFHKSVEIEERSDLGPAVDRTLTSRYHALPGSGERLPFERAVQQLQSFMEMTKMYAHDDPTVRVQKGREAARERART